MTNATQEKARDKSTLTGFSFGLEADERRNGDILLQSIPGARLRGAIDASKPTITHPMQNMGDWEPTIPPDQSSGLGALPKIPGQQIFVNPDKLTYRIFDPLRDNEELCNRIVSAMKVRGQSVSSDRINGLKEVSGKLHVDSMKTLCRELRWLLEAGDMKTILGTGDLPSMKEIDAMKGDYLLNPGATTKWLQPRYEKEVDSWTEQLARTGS